MGENGGGHEQPPQEDAEKSTVIAAIAPTETDVALHVPDNVLAQTTQVRTTDEATGETSVDRIVLTPHPLSTTPEVTTNSTKHGQGLQGGLIGSNQAMQDPTALYNEYAELRDAHPNLPVETDVDREDETEGANQTFILTYGQKPQPSPEPVDINEARQSYKGTPPILPGEDKGKIAGKFHSNDPLFIANEIAKMQAEKHLIESGFLDPEAATNRLNAQEEGLQPNAKLEAKHPDYAVWTSHPGESSQSTDDGDKPPTPPTPPPKGPGAA